MRYKVYYKNSRCLTSLKGDICFLKKTIHRHIWPEDTTEIEFSVDGTALSYSISNLSDRTKYLYDNDLLAIGLFVIEERKKYSGKNWRSKQSIKNHSNRRYIRHWHVDDLEGEIDIGEGPYSNVLSNLFSFAAEHHDPYREDGYDNLYIGVGRDYGDGSGFRPHKMSESSVEVWIDNYE